MDNLYAEMVKTLQNKTGADVVKCRLALLDCNWNLELAEKLIGDTEKTFIDTIHIHSTDKVGVMVEFGCESERATKTQEFKDFINDLFYQIAILKPEFVSPEDASWDSSDESSFESSKYLLLQQSLKDQSRTVGDLLLELSEKLGETCYIKRFIRWEVGQEIQTETKQENTKKHLIAGAVLLLLGIVGSLIMMVSL